LSLWRTSCSKLDSVTAVLISMFLSSVVERSNACAGVVVPRA
jgi:hypothetical protein